MSDSSPLSIQSASDVVDAGFGERFAQMLNELNLSQNEFARQLGSTSAFVSNVARGKSKPGLEFLQRIAETFGISLDWLILGKGTPGGQQGLDAEWHYAVMLRVALAQLITEGSPGADALAKELLDPTASKTGAADGREELLAELATRTRHANLIAAIYNQHLGEQDVDRRNSDALTSAIARLKASSADPLAAMLNTQPSTRKAEVPTTRTQIQTGDNSKMAGRNFTER